MERMRANIAGVLIALAAWALAGCGGPVRHEVPAGPTGWVVAGISKDEPYGTVEISIRRVGTTSGRRTLGYNTVNSPIGEMQSEGRVVTYVDALQLAPGQYELVNFRLFHGAMNFTFNAKADFSVPFEVKENEVTYLGDFLATGTYYKPIIIAPAIENPYFVISEQQSRDLPQAIKRNPGIADKPVKNAGLVRTAPARTPFFKTRKVAEKP